LTSVDWQTSLKFALQLPEEHSMAEADDSSETKYIGVSILAQDIRKLVNLTSSLDADNRKRDMRSSLGKLTYLSMMSHSIAHILSKQADTAGLADAWMELSTALEDVSEGKSADLFRLLKEPGAQPKRIGASREMHFSIATAVHDLAGPDERDHVMKVIAKILKVEIRTLTNFRKNLTRGNPNIKSAEAIEYYDGVYRGLIRVDETGTPVLGSGEPSPVANWLKWFKTLIIVEV
jgi:hypothetical protein